MTDVDIVFCHQSPQWCSELMCDFLRNSLYCNNAFTAWMRYVYGCMEIGRI